MSYKTRCERCDESELRELTKFVSKVFDVDFPNYLPYIYGERATTGHNHFVVREDGEYAAAVLNFPNDLHVGDSVLGTTGVGTVCVREESRGKGYMSDLLASCLIEADESGASFLILSGQRQRYEYYGFAATGIYSSYCVDSASKRHCIGDRPSLFTIEEATKDDGALCVEIMKEQPVYADRYAEHFYDTTAHDGNKLFIIREGGRAVGYFISNREITYINELVFRRDLDPAKAIDELVLAGFSRGTHSMRFEVPYYQFRLAERLSAISEGWNKGAYAGICFIDVPAAVNAFGKLRDLGEDADGTKFVMEIEEHPFLRETGVAREGKTHGRFRFFVKDGFLQMEQTDLPADITLPFLRAEEVLFSDLGALAYDLPARVRGVLPVPFHFPGADKV